jgi:SulP family sulfate permease
MLKRSPPSRSPPDHEDDDDKSLQGGEDGAEDRGQGRLIITPNGVRADDTERTPLLPKNPSFEVHHPDWIRGEPDLEGQGIKRQTSWPKLRNLALWPREKGYDIAVTVLNPKRWNGKTIWRDAVMAPLGYFPAAVLGTLLNILDALSYGIFFSDTLQLDIVY